MDEQTKLPDHSGEAERAVLGALMTSSDGVPICMLILSGIEFYYAQHRTIYDSIKKLSSENRSCDAVTVYEDLQESGVAGQFENVSYLVDIQFYSHNSSEDYVKKYAEIVRDKYVLRQLSAIGQRIYEIANTPDGTDVYQKKARCEALLAEIGNQDATDAVKDLKDVLVEVIEKMQNTLENGSSTMTTGIDVLDEKIVDFRPGSLVVIAGNAGMGKTSLAMQIALHVADKYGTVLFETLEMNDVALGERLIAATSGVSVGKLYEARLMDDEWARISFANGKLSESKLKIKYSGGATVADIRSRALRVNRKNKLKAVFIDYLQIMNGEGMSRNEQISKMTRSLKAMAMDLGCAVVILSQINRDFKDRTDKRPKLSDLRDSGAIEQDADLVLFPYREAYHNKDADNRLAEIDIAKQRSGPTCRVDTGWDAEKMVFLNLSESELLDIKRSSEESRQEGKQQIIRHSFHDRR